MEFQSDKLLARYGHEDRYSESQMTLFALLGICVARVQEIEHLMAHSFILGAVAGSKTQRNLTVAEFIKSWKKKTLGQMLQTIEQSWEVEPTILASLRLFLQMRNELVHGLTTSDQYDLHTAWGQDEAVRFLSTFEMISRPIREAFRASVYASVDTGNKSLEAHEQSKCLSLSARKRKKIGLFVAFFKPRQLP